MRPRNRHREFADPLFGGLTRPPMFAGVTQKFFVINLMVSAQLFLATRSFLAMVITGGLAHGIGYLLCLKEPRIFDILIAKLQYTGPVRNASIWGGNSYDAF